MRPICYVLRQEKNPHLNSDIMRSHSPNPKLKKRNMKSYNFYKFCRVFLQFNTRMTVLMSPFHAY